MGRKSDRKASESSVDHHQMASDEAIWSWSTLFSKKDKTGYCTTRVKIEPEQDPYCLKTLQILWHS